MEFSDQELLRYSRQIMLPAFDIAGQQSLATARVLIVGLGGLGSPVAMYLAAAGVGTLVLADADVVDESNLQRQIAHTESRIGDSKVASAAKAIQALNSCACVITVEERLEGDGLISQVKLADVVVDATDNFGSRFAINRACVTAGKPLVSGAAIRMEGQVSVFAGHLPGQPCYQCLYNEVSEEQLTCSEAGVMAPLVGIIGSVQAMETVKVISGLGQSLQGRLLMLDAMTMEWRSMKLRKDSACPVCNAKAE